MLFFFYFFRLRLLISLILSSIFWHVTLYESVRIRLFRKVVSDMRWLQHFVEGRMVVALEIVESDLRAYSLQELIKEIAARGALIKISDTAWAMLQIVSADDSVRLVELVELRKYYPALEDGVGSRLITILNDRPVPFGCSPCLTYVGDKKLSCIRLTFPACAQLSGVESLEFHLYGTAFRYFKSGEDQPNRDYEEIHWEEPLRYSSRS